MHKKETKKIGSFEPVFYAKYELLMPSVLKIGYKISAEVHIMKAELHL